MKKSSVFERHRLFKERRVGVQDNPGNGQPKTKRTDANVDRVRTFVLSDWRFGVRLIAEEWSMRICSEDRIQTLA
jgi:hypothetical protein